MELARRTAAIPTRRDVLTLLLADNRNANTRRAYRANLVDFFEGEPTPQTLQAFFSQDVPGMAYTLNAYKADLLKRKLSEATVNLRLSAVRSLIRHARRVGQCDVDPRGLVEGERVQQYRDTTGIGVDAMRRLLDLPDTGTVKGKRDAAILRLLWENGLRRAELCGLDVPDFVPAEGRLYIIGKGRGSQKEPITVSERAVSVILAYLDATGRTVDAGGPLFANCDRRGGGGRLTTEGLYKLVQRYGELAGLPRRLSPHRLRHTAITAALDSTEGDVRAVQRFSRHAKIETLMVYDDNRRNFQGEITERLSELA